MKRFTIFYDSFYTEISVNPDRYTIWEFQDMIMRKIHLTSDKLVCLLHERGVLGKDIEYSDGLYKLSYSPTVYAIINHYAETFPAPYEDTRKLFREYVNNNPGGARRRRGSRQRGASQSLPNSISQYTYTFDMPANFLTTLMGAMVGSSFGDTFESFFESIYNLEDVPITLDKEAIEKLPIFKYGEIKDKLKDEEKCNNFTQCSICLENYVDESKVRVLLCKHVYHKDCIDTWLSEHNVTCPLCRIDTRDAVGETGM
jgi:hypothetical protein